MSLINDMLRDLADRRKHEQQGKTFTEVPVAVKGRTVTSTRWWILGAAVLVIGAIVWLVVSSLPLTSQDIPEQTAVVQLSQQAEEVSDIQATEIEGDSKPPAEQQNMTASLSLAAEKSEAVNEVEEPAPKLLGLTISESSVGAALVLRFNGLPQYRLEKDSDSAEPSVLVISLSGVQLDDAFEIPERTGKLLERISLRPQKKRLQLLVDLASHTEAGSYELRQDDGSGYTLQIDIKEKIALTAAVTEKSEGTKKVQPEVVKKAEPQAAKQAAEVSLDSLQNDAAHLSRSENRLSPDEQAYQSGLEQMRQENFAAAERDFAAALEKNPAHVQARTQLIAVLQQQNKSEQALAQMREGLSKTPRSIQLRKMYARYLLSQQHNLEAIEVLQAQPIPPVAQDLEYHAFLAALLQETEQFSAAAQLYATLLQLRPETAIWWFGLAVSMDQAGDFEQARNAYSRALALPGLSADVQKYVQNRLQVL